MWLSFLAFFVAVILFVLALKATMVYIGKRFGETVRTRHEAAEEILETGLPPAQWLERLGPRALGSKADAASTARARLLKRLDGLVRYFDSAPVFDSEQTRQDVLGQLRTTREQWETMSGAELYHELNEESGSDSAVDS